MGNDSNINLIAVYVDDLLIVCSDLNELNRIKSQISEIESDGVTRQIIIHQNDYIKSFYVSIKWKSAVQFPPH